jgi:glucose/arabinose dehydrogenase
LLNIFAEKRVASLFVIIIATISGSILVNYYLPQITRLYNELSQAPFIYQSSNNDLLIELVADGLAHPSSMTFVDDDTILVLEKDTGKVRIVNDGILEKDQLLNVTVNAEAERGLLGIDILKRRDGQTNVDDYVLIYFTEVLQAKNQSSDDVVRNRIYRYNWNGTNLFNPVLLLDLPGEPGPYHNGGKIKIGPDNQLYLVIGDLTSPSNILQNHLASGDVTPDNTSVIIRINPIDGNPSTGNPFRNQNDPNNSSNLNYYYAYGIRNSFGISFDPITGILWDTENGEDKFDEVNIVKPGFNSGWNKIMGPKSKNSNFSEDKLIMLENSYYSDPKFSWFDPIGVTDIEFYNSTKLGDRFSNNVFIGDINFGRLYFFEMNDNRTGIETGFFAKNHTDLADSIADPEDDLSPAIFAKGFSGRITDIETGPDGYLYILTYSDGRIYRIIK